MTAALIAVQDHLDQLLPFRTLPLPDTGDPCESYGHLPGCDCECCEAPPGDPGASDHHFTGW